MTGNKGILIGKLEKAGVVDDLTDLSEQELARMLLSVHYEHHEDEDYDGPRILMDSEISLLRKTYNI